MLDNTGALGSVMPDNTQRGSLVNVLLWPRPGTQTGFLFVEPPISVFEPITPKLTPAVAGVFLRPVFYRNCLTRERAGTRRDTPREETGGREEQRIRIPSAVCPTDEGPRSDIHMRKHVVFVVDASRSMERRDVFDDGQRKRRVDAVLDSVFEFVEVSTVGRSSGSTSWRGAWTSPSRYAVAFLRPFYH